MSDSPDPDHSDEPDQNVPEPEPEPLPLLPLRDGVPGLIDTEDKLADYVDTLARGSGPVGIDAERASGYRYSGRAYLIQLRRQGAGTALIDPIAFGDLSSLDAAIGEDEWILHAATQDLPCLREVGMNPTSVFDTELAGRLLGYPRVGLASLVETITGQTMRKEHSAADWSERPLPDSWLEYAALDVEVLDELRDHLTLELQETGKDVWAAQEFQHLLDFQPRVYAEPWRRTSGINRIRKARNLAAVKALWEARDALARQRDISPSKLIPDSAISVAATTMPTSVSALLGTKGFHGRGAKRFSAHWIRALDEARSLPEDQLPGPRPPNDGPPQVRQWADRDPGAAARFNDAREAVRLLGEDLHVPVENLLTPDYLRRVLWSPPQVAGTDLECGVADALQQLGARPWQIELTAPVIAAAILSHA